MKINEKIIQLLKLFDISEDDGICYLISLFHGYNPSYIPNEFKRKMNTTLIYEVINRSIHWKIPLYEGQETHFDWVLKEYLDLFIKHRPDLTRYGREAVPRMKKLFSEHPEIRKEDVLLATKNYIEATETDYIRRPHYFIQKGNKITGTSDLLSWIDSLKTENSIKEEKKNSIYNSLQ